MFFEEGNALNTFVRPQQYTQCIFVGKTECKQNSCLFARKLHRAPLMRVSSYTKM